MNRMIRLMLVDDHTLFREGLARLLEAENGFELVGHFSSTAEALAAPELNSVHVVLLDFDLGENRGLQFLGESREMGFRGRILMVTAGMSEVDALQALGSGASGIFLKHNPPASLITAIHRVVAGEPWLDQSSFDSLIGAGHPQSQAASQFWAQPTRTSSAQRRLRGIDEQGDSRPAGDIGELCQSGAPAIVRQNWSSHPKPVSAGCSREAHRIGRRARPGSGS